MSFKQSEIDSRRAQHLSERGFSESLLGFLFSVRIYAISGNVGRGTVMIACKDGYLVHTAYISLNGASVSVGATVKARVVGVIFDNKREKVSIMLDADCSDKKIWTQSDIAEAMDFWDSSDSQRIYCLREKSCGAVVFTQDGGVIRYLLIRMNLGHCGLPKGHVEKFETEYETAIREVREETGVSITLIDGFRESVVYSISPRTTKESIYFLGKFSGEDIVIQETEVSDYKLCPYEEARKLVTYENDRAVLDAANAFLTKQDDK